MTIDNIAHKQDSAPSHYLRGKRTGVSGSIPITEQIVTLEGSSLASGQVTVATGSAVALASTADVKYVHLFAPPENNEPVYIGPSGVTVGTGYALHPGATLTVWIDDIAKIFQIAANAGPILHYLAGGTA